MPDGNIGQLNRGSGGAAPSLGEVIPLLNEVAVPRGFRCKQESWEDSQRQHSLSGGLESGTAASFGNLGNAGPNISDVRLLEKNGREICILRSDNWNERIGMVSADRVKLAVGNHKPPESSLSHPVIESLALGDFLACSGKYTKYGGVTSRSLLDRELDRTVSVRFQTVFLPVSEGGSVEFCTEVFSYNTSSEKEPRNLLLLCTSQGCSVQEDTVGQQKLYFHCVDTLGNVDRHFLKAEASAHGVGGAELGDDDDAEAYEDEDEAGAMSMEIGVEGMGSRFNAVMLIQVPLKQKEIPSKPPPVHRFSPGKSVNPGPGQVAVQTTTGELVLVDADPLDTVREFKKRFAELAWGGEYPEILLYDGSLRMVHRGCEVGGDYADADDKTINSFGVIPGESTVFNYPNLTGGGLGGGSGRGEERPKGESYAAWLSIGSKADRWKGCRVPRPERDPEAHVTVTITLYYTVSGGVPSVEDVACALDDLEALYRSCEVDTCLHAGEVTAAV